VLKVKERDRLQALEEEQSVADAEAEVVSTAGMHGADAPFTMAKATPAPTSPAPMPLMDAAAQRHAPEVASEPFVSSPPARPVTSVSNTPATPFDAFDDDAAVGNAQVTIAEPNPFGFNDDAGSAPSAAPSAPSSATRSAAPDGFGEDDDVVV
jgi:hypothetical protein